MTQQKINQTIKKNLEKFDAYDLIHIPLPQHLPKLSKFKSPFLVTVHDITHKLFPEFHQSANVLQAEKGMQQIMETKADVIVISEATQKDVVENYDITDPKYIWSLKQLAEASLT